MRGTAASSLISSAVFLQDARTLGIVVRHLSEGTQQTVANVLVRLGAQLQAPEGTSVGGYGNPPSCSILVNIPEGDITILRGFVGVLSDWAGRPEYRLGLKLNEIPSSHTLTPLPFLPQPTVAATRPSFVLSRGLLLLKH